MDFTTGLNDKQKEAVLHTEGPLLILAGAGSGKTRVLTHRIAHLVENKGVAPWSILAITFTNKAAQEMKARVASLIGEEMANDMWVSTFHSMCVRILRRNPEELGYGRYFTIYDTADQKSLLKDILKVLNINEKNFPIGTVLGAISSKKNELITPETAVLKAGDDYREKIIAQVYSAYQKKLKDNNAMDFDDLLVNTYLLFRDHENILSYYQNKFRYILVDEYQDTNGAQYQLVQMLAKRHLNLCVVGDDDQSIYGWRGADISNILDFEKDFNSAAVIKLEQNYRSTQNILNAANSVVAHNKGRKVKKLWTDNEEGQEITILQANNEYREADLITRNIIDSIEQGEREYKDFAILYRTNAQSRILEEKMVGNSIPYRLLGGTRFYERKEIKDLISYLKVVANTKDDVAIKRIINVPKRGVGTASVNTITDYAMRQNMDFFEAARLSKELGILGAGPSQKVISFTSLIEELKEIVQTSNNIQTLLQAVIEKIDYLTYIRQTEAETAEDRIQNIEELISKTMHYMSETDEPSLEAFLEEVALVADIDNYDEESNSVVLMTLHSAKGLEFPVVFIPGVEEGLFPSYMSMTEGEDKLEEERRLCYVGITRAREKLYMLYAEQRTLFGQTKYSLPSRFIKELPNETTNLAKLNQQKKSFMANAMGEKKTFEVKTSPKPEMPVLRGQGSMSSSLNTASKKIENLPKPIFDFTEGDAVSHKMFGQGTITEINKIKDDVFVTIQFKSGETRQLSTRFAKLQKL
ncbi:MAG: pcrA [Clostridia bacterium]|jgi:DNA helicase-2/ATP-dependent DNA helicase PcrA|nr:pcrA [Clostridia bacterium]